MEPRVYRLMNQPQKYHNNPIRPAANHAPSRLSRFRVSGVKISRLTRVAGPAELAPFEKETARAIEA